MTMTYWEQIASERAKALLDYGISANLASEGAYVRVTTSEREYLFEGATEKWLCSCSGC